MEIMEDGNLMDKIQILIQRDFEYYKQNQKVLQELLCTSVIGGRLDFPRNASFAAVKLVIWWEEEYVAAYRKSSGLFRSTTDLDITEEDPIGGCGGIVKASDPNKFVNLVTKSGEQLLKHLHILTQEALDHADLTVLTGTIGAAALLRNCLWCYLQQSKFATNHKNNTQLMSTCHKQYQEMSEALAERLLDLHCRLLSLYILQDADSLDWEDSRPFFESERGSFIVQMWWLYMQGTRQNLWNTVPPRMAQRVFAGMLNESLTILSVRYSQACPSACRSKLFSVDISNLLLCITELLPAVCETGEELAGLALNTQNHVIRDIHAKCQELFFCLLLRGAPLDTLNKLFRQGDNAFKLNRVRNAGPSPWFVFTSPQLFPKYPKDVIHLQDLTTDTAIALELSVLLIQPQPNWALVLKVLLMRKCKVASLILTQVTKNMPPSGQLRKDLTITKCDGFLCTNEGLCTDKVIKSTLVTHISKDYLTMAITHILLTVGNPQDIATILLPAIEATGQNWADCFDRRQVWNQKRPPWFESIISIVKPFMGTITSTVINAVHTGASMYQSMSLILACLNQLWICIPISITRISAQFTEILPSDITPLGNSVLLQILSAAIYSALLDKSEKSNENEKSSSACSSKTKEFTDKIKCERNIELEKSRMENDGKKLSVASFDGTINPVESIALAIAEGLCSIDEDNKHTEEIEELLEKAAKSLLEEESSSRGCASVEFNRQMAEILVSDVLMTTEGKKGIRILYQFICSNHDWLYRSLGMTSPADMNLEPNRMTPETQSLLYTMFHIKNRPFDQFLTEVWKPDWYHLLKIPMGLSADRIWTHVSKRWDFRDQSSLSAQELQIIASITKFLRPN